MRTVRQFLRLDAWERRILIRSMVLLPVIGLLLRAAGLRGTQATLGKLVGVAQPVPGFVGRRRESEREVARRTASLVAIAAGRGPWKATCLPQALASWWLLARRTIPVELRIGIRKLEGELQAHAWVEYQGEALPSGVRGFNPLGRWQPDGELGERELEACPWRQDEGA